MLHRHLDLVPLPAAGLKHSHQHHQVVLNVNGTAEFELEGGGSGQLNHFKGCIIPSNCAHAYQGIGENQMLLFNCDPAPSAITYLYNDALKQLFDQPQFFDIDDAFKRLIDVAVTEMAQSPDYANLEPPLMQIIAQALIRRLSFNTHTPKTGPVDRRINLVTIDQWISKNIGQPINVSDLARLCCLSVSQFHRRFQAAVGCSPYQYILNARIRRALWMLRHTDQPFSSIAASVGFSTQSAFCKAIKKQTGVTPNQLRSTVDIDH